MFVPLLIGRGRLAQHLAHALKSQNIHFFQILDARNLREDPSLILKLSCSTHAWILTKDEAIEPIALLLKSIKDDLKIIHSSAASEIPGTSTLHPLMTFSETLYDAQVYPSIPWIQFSNEAIVPEFPFMKRVTLDPSERTRYHAACVIISNFSNLLWNSGTELIPSLKRDHFLPILTQTLINFMNQGAHALTGPLKRNDQLTISKHLTALAKLPTQKLYESFVQFYGESNHDHRT